MHWLLKPQEYLLHLSHLPSIRGSCWHYCVAMGRRNASGVREVQGAISNWPQVGSRFSKHMTDTKMTNEEISWKETKKITTKVKSHEEKS